MTCRQASPGGTMSKGRGRQASSSPEKVEGAEVVERSRLLQDGLQGRRHGGRHRCGLVRAGGEYSIFYFFFSIC